MTAWALVCHVYPCNLLDVNAVLLSRKQNSGCDWFHDWMPLIQSNHEQERGLQLFQVSSNQCWLMNLKFALQQKILSLPILKCHTHHWPFFFSFFFVSMVTHQGFVSTFCIPDLESSPHFPKHPHPLLRWLVSDVALPENWGITPLHFSHVRSEKEPDDMSFLNFVVWFCFIFFLFCFIFFRAVLISREESNRFIRNIYIWYDM